MSNQNAKATAILVHAAWADGSSWNKVTEELQRKGVNVVAAQIPLTSFTDDVASLRKVLLRQEGPLVLAGHSYGGAVITAAAAGNPKVKALVYVAAIVPDEGETVDDVFHRVAPHPSAPKLQPDADGFLWLNVEAFRAAVAPDASLSDRSHGCNAKTDFANLLGGTDGQASLERKTELVSHRRKRSHGVSRNATIHSRENEVQNHFPTRRPHSVGFQACRSR